MDCLATEILTPGDETRYIKSFMPLVLKVVKQQIAQANCVVGEDDMTQIALMGLLAALRRYGHPDQAFASYATQRVRGAVLDELRHQDWRPRRLRQKVHKFNDAIREMVREVGHVPRFEELRLRLAITFEEYQEYLQLDGASTLESLDCLLSNDVHISALESRSLEEEMLSRRMLCNAIASLDPRERRILTFYHQHEMSLKQIALIQGVTEARVCQINKMIAQKIHDFLDQ
ncbi:sigma-70 family RNA polymerase sigma factor [Salmonella enterica]